MVRSCKSCEKSTDLTQNWPLSSKVAGKSSRHMLGKQIFNCWTWRWTSWFPGNRFFFSWKTSTWTPREDHSGLSENQLLKKERKRKNNDHHFCPLFNGCNLRVSPPKVDHGVMKLEVALIPSPLKIGNVKTPNSSYTVTTILAFAFWSKWHLQMKAVSCRAAITTTTRQIQETIISWLKSRSLPRSWLNLPFRWKVCQVFQGALKSSAHRIFHLEAICTSSAKEGIEAYFCILSTSRGLWSKPFIAAELPILVMDHALLVPLKPETAMPGKRRWGKGFPPWDWHHWGADHPVDGWNPAPPKGWLNPRTQWEP